MVKKRRIVSFFPFVPQHSTFLPFYRTNESIELEKQTHCYNELNRLASAANQRAYQRVYDRLPPFPI